MKKGKNLWKTDLGNVLATVGFWEMSFRICPFRWNVYSRICIQGFDCEPYGALKYIYLNMATFGDT